MLPDRREFLRATASVAVTPVLASTVLAEAPRLDVTEEMLHAYLFASDASIGQINTLFKARVEDHLRAAGITPRIVSTAQFAKEVALEPGKRVRLTTTVPHLLVDMIDMLDTRRDGRDVLGNGLVAADGSAVHGQHRRDVLLAACPPEQRSASNAIGKRLLDFYHSAAKIIATTLTRVPPERLICVRTPNLWIKREAYMVDAFAWSEMLCYS